MGQRTNLIVQEVCAIDKENTKFAKRTLVYHNQWGLGSGMLKDAMAYLLTHPDSNAVGREDIYSDNCTNILAPKWVGKAHLETDGTVYDEATDLGLSNQSIDSFADIQDIEEHCDNNNGVIVLKIVRNRYNTIEGGTFAILKGGEDCDFEIERPFTRTLSLKEYQDMWICKDKDGNLLKDEDGNVRTYCPPEIVSAFRALCRYYNIKPARLGVRKPTDKSLADRIAEYSNKAKVNSPVAADM